MNPQQHGPVAKKYAWMVQVVLLALSVSTIKLPTGKTVGEVVAEVVAPAAPGGPPAGGQWLRDLTNGMSAFNARMLNGAGPLSPEAAASLTTGVFVCFVFLWLQRWFGSGVGEKLPERVLEATITPGVWALAFCYPSAAAAMALAHVWFAFNYPTPKEVYVFGVDTNGTVHGARVK